MNVICQSLLLISRRLIIITFTSALVLLAFWWAHSTRAIAQGPPVCVTPPTGMVSWWSGDGNANDIVGTNDGTLNGVAFTAGKVGQAFSFNGTDAHVHVLDNTNLYPGAGPFTVDAWIKTTQRSSDGAFILAHYECANGCPSGAANSVYAMYIDENGMLGGFLRDSAGTQQTITSARVVADGVYHHIALVRDTTGLQMQLYVDGVVDASAPLTVTGTIKDDDGEPDPFTIGAIIAGGTDHPAQLFLGEVDEVEYFNRVLTAAEIQTIVNADSAGKCKPSSRQCAAPPTGMVSWLPGDGNANDIKGTNHGTLQNGATFGAGLVGQAFALDGSNDYVDLGNAPSLHVSAGDFTVDTWVRFNAPGGDMSIVDKMSVGGVNVDGWRLLKQGDNHFWFCLGGGSGNGCTPGGATTVISTTSATTGTWFHVTAVKSSTEIAIYINGVKEASKPPSPFADTHSANLLIGSYILQGAFLNGLVDEVEIFNRALSASEIQAIARANSAGKCKNTAPIARCQNVTVSAGPSCTANASIDNDSSDPDGDPLTLTQSPLGPYPVGMTNVMLTVTDGNGGSSSCSATVTVVDDTPPTISGVSASPSSLWPPNHKMVNVTINYSASDNCGATTCVISSVTSNEPVNGTGDGDTAPDWEIVDVQHVRLRAERAGNGNGRIYTITITCTDGSGNSSNQTVTVTVPKSQGH